MTNREAVNWLRNIAADIGKAEHRELWHYEQALFEIMEMLDAQPDLDEWCDTCREYDQERHCCPRYNRVIREAVEEAKPEIIHCLDCKHWKNRHLCEPLSRYGTFETKQDFFCGYGKRREEE